MQNLFLSSKGKPGTVLLLTLLLLFTLFLNACGFHLRGAVELPEGIHKLAIEDTATGSNIAPVIALQLKRNGITPLKSQDNAELVLIINSEAYGRRVMTVSSVGQVQEFELSYDVDYSIKNVKDAGASLMRQKLSIKRDLRFAVDEVLGKASEEARLRKDMLVAASERILRRVPRVASKTSVQ